MFAAVKVTEREFDPIFGSNPLARLGESDKSEVMGKIVPDCSAFRKRNRFREAGWDWGRASAIDSSGRTIWIADAHRGDWKRFVVRADEKRTAFVELESTIRA
jgi:hypothetical protein